jgi:hypothetical protein
MLRREHHGARPGWRVGNVPSVTAEEHRHRPRALATLQPERARPSHRIKGVRRRQWLRLARVPQWPAPLDELRLWAGTPGPSVRGRGLRVEAPDECLGQQLAE